MSTQVLTDKALLNVNPKSINIGTSISTVLSRSGNSYTFNAPHNLPALVEWCISHGVRVTHIRGLALATAKADQVVAIARMTDAQRAVLAQKVAAGQSLHDIVARDETSTFFNYKVQKPEKVVATLHNGKEIDQYLAAKTPVANATGPTNMATSNLVTRAVRAYASYKVGKGNGDDVDKLVQQMSDNQLLAYMRITNDQAALDIAPSKKAPANKLPYDYFK